MRPIDIFIKQGLLPQAGPEAEAVAVTAEQAVSALPRKIEVKCLADFVAPVPETDGTELIRNRFLYLGGMMLFTGPTGIGKSSFLMQFLMHMGVGREIFGLRPGRMFEGGMRILIVQAENDDGDIAEMRDGVLRGCGELSPEERTRCVAAIQVATICDRTSDGFAAELAALIQAYPCDLVVVDPAFAYLGGDSNSQKDVSHFMRELMHPMAKKYKVGMIIVHHTVKPPSGREKTAWEAGDWAYAGSGSSEWANPCRCTMTIRSVGSLDVFELIAGKRGKRLGMRNGVGALTTSQYIAHHGGEGVICWRTPAPEELAELGLDETRVPKKAGRGKIFDHCEMLHCVRLFPGENRVFYTEKFSKATKVSQKTAQRFLDEMTEYGLLQKHGDSSFRRYVLTESGLLNCEKKPTAFNWSEEG
jgi:hypothetical protein